MAAIVGGGNRFGYGNWFSSKDTIERKTCRIFESRKNEVGGDEAK